MSFMDRARERRRTHTHAVELLCRRVNSSFTTHNKHKRQTSMRWAGFEPQIAAINLPKTYTLTARPSGSVAWQLTAIYFHRVDVKLVLSLQDTAVRWTCFLFSKWHFRLSTSSSELKTVSFLMKQQDVCSFKQRNDDTRTRTGCDVIKFMTTRFIKYEN
jgi:hypothetical protein